MDSLTLVEVFKEEAVRLTRFSGAQVSVTIVLGNQLFSQVKIIFHEKTN